MADEVIGLAYDAALSALREQDATLTSLRNRATGLLAAAAVGTSFAATVGLLDAESGSTLPDWVAWTLLALVVLIGASVLTVLWPAPRWSYGPQPARLLDAAGQDVDAVRRTATRALLGAIEMNNRSIDLRMRAYRIGAALLLAEVVVLVLGLLIQQN